MANGYPDINLLRPVSILGRGGVTSAIPGGLGSVKSTPVGSFGANGFAGAAASLAPWVFGMAALPTVMSMFGPNFRESFRDSYNSRVNGLDFSKTSPLREFDSSPRLNDLVEHNLNIAQNRGVPGVQVTKGGGLKPYEVYSHGKNDYVYMPEGNDLGLKGGVSLSRYSREKNAKEWRDQAKLEEERGR